ncbi:hypothetical protein, partial [Salmonella enterica]|uniref:hypothetical protein n=1 Tax=Salmonella enterica TaxID=28901 RepID=UPI001F3D6658
LCDLLQYLATLIPFLLLYQIGLKNKQLHMHKIGFIPRSINKPHLERFGIIIHIHSTMLY